MPSRGVSLVCCQPCRKSCAWTSSTCRQSPRCRRWMVYTSRHMYKRTLPRQCMERSQRSSPMPLIRRIMCRSFLWSTIHEQCPQSLCVCRNMCVDRNESLLQSLSALVMVVVVVVVQYLQCRPVEWKVTSSLSPLSRHRPHRSLRHMYVQWSISTASPSSPAMTYRPSQPPYGCLSLSVALSVSLCHYLSHTLTHSYCLFVSVGETGGLRAPEILRVCVRKRVDRCASMSSGRRRSLHLILLHSDTFGRQWSSEDDSSVSLLLLVESESVQYHAVQRANFGREHV